MLVLISLGVTALGFVGYAMWPRWPDAPVAADAPALPVVVAGAGGAHPPDANAHVTSIRNPRKARPAGPPRSQPGLLCHPHGVSGA